MPSEETIGEVKDVFEEKIQAATLVHDGKLLYEMARYDQAEAKLRLALKIDPANRGASYYMVLVQEAKNTIQVKKRDLTSRGSVLQRLGFSFAALYYYRSCKNLITRANRIHWKTTTQFPHKSDLNAS